MTSTSAATGQTRASSRPTGLTCSARGVEETVIVQQTGTDAQQIPGAVVRRHDPPAPVELHDAQSGGVKQLRKRPAQSAGPGQRLLNAHSLTNMRQQIPD